MKWNEDILDHFWIDDKIIMKGLVVKGIFMREKWIQGGGVL